MKKILHLISSFRGADSYTAKLGHAIVDKLKTANPGAIVGTGFNRRKLSSPGCPSFPGIFNAQSLPY